MNERMKMQEAGTRLALSTVKCSPDLRPKLAANSTFRLSNI